MYCCAEVVVGALPRSLAYAAGSAAACGAATIAPQRFRALADNLRHAAPHATPRQLRGLVRRNVVDLAKSWVDVMQMRRRADSLASRLRIHDLHRYTELAATGQGVVVVSLHFGCWEVGLAAWNRLGHPLSLLAELIRPPELFERIAGARGSLGVKVIPLDVAAIREASDDEARRLAASPLREVMRLLRDGGTVAMAMDRDLIGNGVKLHFFDQPAPIPLGVVDIAIRTRSAILPVVLQRSDPLIDAWVYPPIAYDASARGEEVRRVAGEALRVFEAHIRARPDQWHVLDSVWDQR